MTVKPFTPPPPAETASALIEQAIGVRARLDKALAKYQRSFTHEPGRTTWLGQHVTTLAVREYAPVIERLRETLTQEELDARLGQIEGRLEKGFEGWISGVYDLRLVAKYERLLAEYTVLYDAVNGKPATDTVNRLRSCEEAR